MNSQINAQYESMLEILNLNAFTDNELSLKHIIKAFVVPGKNLDDWITRRTMVSEGKAYFIPNEQLYRAMTVLYLVSQRDVRSFDISGIEVSELASIVYFLKEAVKKIKQKPDRFPVDPVGLFEKWETLINQLEGQHKEYHTAQIISEPISERRINEFKEMITKQWEKSRTLSKVFESFNAVLYNPVDKLKYVGLHRINFKGARIMFVENNYQKIYNIEWGNQVSDAVCRLFLETIRSSKEKEIIQQETYLEALDAIIELNVEINIAFISLATSFLIARPLAESGNFMDYQAENISDLPFTTLGLYKERLLLIPMRNHAIGDGIVSVQLPGAIIMKRKTNDDWIDKKLQLDITEITDDNAAEVFKASNPNADLNDKAQIDLVKTGILIEIDETIDFEILKPKNIIVAVVKERID